MERCEFCKGWDDQFPAIGDVIGRWRKEQWNQALHRFEREFP